MNYSAISTRRTALRAHSIGVVCTSTATAPQMYATGTAADLFTLAEEIQERCRNRGFALALPQELQEEVRAIQNTLDRLTTRLAGNERIQACLNEYQADLIEHGAHLGPTPTQDWERFRTASAAFTRRIEATTEEVHRVIHLHCRVLRKILALVCKGVV